MAPAHSSLKRRAAVSSPGRSVKVKAEPKSAGKPPDPASLPEGGKGSEAPACEVAADSLPAGGKGAKALPAIPKKDAKLMSQKMGRLASKGKPELKEQYSQCRTQAETRRRISRKPKVKC